MDFKQSLIFLDTWFNSRCDGTWEHQLGIIVETTDNPGWMARIDLNKTIDADFKFAEGSDLSEGTVSGFVSDRGVVFYSASLCDLIRHSARFLHQNTQNQPTGQP